MIVLFESQVTAAGKLSTQPRKRNPAVSTSAGPPRWKPSARGLWATSTTCPSCWPPSTPTSCVGRKTPQMLSAIPGLIPINTSKRMFSKEAPSLRLSLAVPSGVLIPFLMYGGIVLWF